MYTDIKEKIGIKEASDKYKLQIEVEGNGSCPFCQGRSSFHVKDNKYFICYRCEAKGSVIDLLIQSGISKTAGEAVYRLKSDFNVESESSNSNRAKFLKRVFEVYKEEMEKSESEVKNYLDKRGWENPGEVGFCSSPFLLQQAGLDKEELETYDLISYIDKDKNYVEYYDNHLVFPIYDKGGNLRHFSARALDERDLRWKSTKGKPPIMNYFYNSKELHHPQSNYIVICEGVSDCLSLKQLNIPTIGQFGINVELGKYAEDFSKFDYIVAVFDRDKYPLGTSKGGQYISWTQMLPRLIQLMSLSNTPIYYLMTPNLCGIKDINDWLVHIDYDIDEYVEYGIKNSYPISRLAYNMYKGDPIKHGEIWKSLSIMDDPSTLAKLQKLIFDKYGDWRHYMTELFH